MRDAGHPFLSQVSAPAALPLGFVWRNHVSPCIIYVSLLPCRVHPRHPRLALSIAHRAAIVTGASSGNSGIGCTGYDAPPGSLERRLLRRSIQLHPQLYRSLGLSYAHVNKCGALVVAWTPQELLALPAIVAENHEAGDTEARLLDRDELLALEPALSPGEI